MNHRLLFLAVLFLVLASVLIFRSQVKEDDKAKWGSDDPAPNAVDVDGEITDSDRKKLSNRKLSKETIETLRSLGYQFSADKINKRSAVGHVTVIIPDGGILKSDYMSISSDGDYIYLEGEILLEAKSEDEIVRIKYSGEDASAKLGLDGKSLSFTGEMAMATIPSDPDQ